MSNKKGLKKTIRNLEKSQQLQVLFPGKLIFLLSRYHANYPYISPVCESDEPSGAGSVVARNK